MSTILIYLIPLLTWWISHKLLIICFLSFFRTLHRCGRTLWQRRVSCTHACGKFIIESQHLQLPQKNSRISKLGINKSLVIWLYFGWKYLKIVLCLPFPSQSMIIFGSSFWPFAGETCTSLCVCVFLSLFSSLIFRVFVYAFALFYSFFLCWVCCCFMLRLGPNLWRQRQCLAYAMRYNIHT